MDKEQNLIDVALEEADELFFKILEEYPELDNQDPRRSAILLGLMTNCIVQLRLRGWSHKELINEVLDYIDCADRIDQEE
jgi:hypothetical protein